MTRNAQEQEEPWFCSLETILREESGFVPRWAPTGPGLDLVPPHMGHITSAE